MSAYPSQRVRLAVNLQSHTPVVDSITNANALIWRSTDVRFEVALFNGAALLTPLDNITTLYFSILVSRIGAPVVEKTFAGASLNTALTMGEWTAGLEASCHAYFELTCAETHISLPDSTVNNTATLWWVLYALTTGDVALHRTYGGGILTVEESGANNLSVLAATDGLRNVSGQPYIYNRETGKWNHLCAEGAGVQRHLVLDEEVSL